MLTIMLVIYTRTNSSISIIFIFLVRIYQNQMLNSIQEFVKIKIIKINKSKLSNIF